MRIIYYTTEPRSNWEDIEAKMRKKKFLTDIDVIWFAKSNDERLEIIYEPLNESVIEGNV